MKYVLLPLLLLITAPAMTANAQNPLKLPALSPTTRFIQDFSISSIEITYSRPSMRGRAIFGDFIPYGIPWRTGANSPTKIKTGEDLVIAGQKVKAGEYVLYTIPGRDKWQVILNTGEGAWTADGFPREFDVARFAITPAHIDGDCQTFTIIVTDITLTACKIELIWERTRIVLPVVARNWETIETNIGNAINHPPAKPYYQAASYYFEVDKNIDLANRYLDTALQQNPKAYYAWYLKARIERKLENKDEAIAAAKRSIEAAKGTPAEAEYKRNNLKLIDEVSKSIRRRQVIE